MSLRHFMYVMMDVKKRKTMKSAMPLSAQKRSVEGGKAWGGRAARAKVDQTIQAVP